MSDKTASSGGSLPADARPAPSRRGFFMGTAALGAAAVAATQLRDVAPEAAPAQVAMRAPEGGGGYHESAHVMHYYRTTRI